MAAAKVRMSSFSRKLSNAALPQGPGLKCGPNSTVFLSSGIPDLDNAEAPHHMLLLRNFMAQGFVHNQPLIYASAARDPRGFLGTLPSPTASKDNKSREPDPDQLQLILTPFSLLEKGLRIAWQYKKYFGENQLNFVGQRGIFSMDNMLTVLASKILPVFLLFQIVVQDFYLSFHEMKAASHALVVLLSNHFALLNEWDMLSFSRYLKSIIRSSNTVAMITFPPSLLQKMATHGRYVAFCQSNPRFISSVYLVLKVCDIDFRRISTYMSKSFLLSDEAKELAQLLTGYQDMVGFLNVHKIARINTQVPVILEATTFSIKLQKRRFLVLECLNQAPVNGLSGTSYAAFGSCSASSKTGNLDF